MKTCLRKIKNATQIPKGGKKKRNKNQPPPIPPFSLRSGAMSRVDLVECNAVEEYKTCNQRVCPATPFSPPTATSHKGKQSPTQRPACGGLLNVGQTDRPQACCSLNPQSSESCTGSQPPISPANIIV